MIRAELDLVHPLDEVTMEFIGSSKAMEYFAIAAEGVQNEYPAVYARENNAELARLLASGTREAFTLSTDAEKAHLDSIGHMIMKNGTSVPSREARVNYIERAVQPNRMAAAIEWVASQAVNSYSKQYAREMAGEKPAQSLVKNGIPQPEVPSHDSYEIGGTILRGQFVALESLRKTMNSTTRAIQQSPFYSADYVYGAEAARNHRGTLILPPRESDHETKVNYHIGKAIPPRVILRYRLPLIDATTVPTLTHDDTVVSLYEEDFVQVFADRLPPEQRAQYEEAFRSEALTTLDSHHPFDKASNVSNAVANMFERELMGERSGAFLPLYGCMMVRVHNPYRALIMLARRISQYVVV